MIKSLLKPSYLLVALEVFIYSIIMTLTSAMSVLTVKPYDQMSRNDKIIFFLGLLIVQAGVIKSYMSKTIAKFSPDAVALIDGQTAKLGNPVALAPVAPVPIAAAAAIIAIFACVMFSGCAYKSIDTNGVYGNGSMFGTNSVTTNSVLFTNATTGAVTFTQTVSTNQFLTQAGIVLAEMDSGIAAGYLTISNFVAWEANNRPVLLQLDPGIKGAANYCRTNAPHWRDTAFALRDTYARMPSVDTQSAFNAGTQVMVTAIQQSTTYLSKYTNSVPLK